MIMELLTKRPDGMSFSEYKYKLAQQKKWLSQYLKGKIIHVSAVMETERNFAGMIVKQTIKKNSVPYRKPERRIKI